MNAARLPTDLARMKRMRDQGVPLSDSTLAAIRAAEELEARTNDDDEEAGEEQRVASEDAAEAEARADAAAVGYDVGQYDRGASYRAGVLCRSADGRRWKSRRATDRAPGESDDWALAGGPARSSTRGKFAPPSWLRGVIAEIRTWANETFATRADVERITTTKAGGSTAELEARVAALEERLSGDARAWAAASLADAFAGTFKDGQEYERGQLVVLGGSLWLCLKATDGAVRPGKADCWRLVTKHGRDARSER